MRCEGADNPPCKRCLSGGHDCVFERRADYLLNPEDVAWQSRIEHRVEIIASTVDRILSFLNGQGPCPPAQNAQVPASTTAYASGAASLQPEDQLQAYQYGTNGSGRLASEPLSVIPNFDDTFSFATHDQNGDPTNPHADVGLESLTDHFDPEARYSFASDPGLAAIDGLLRQVADRVAADSRQSSEGSGEVQRMPNQLEQDRLIDL